MLTLSGPDSSPGLDESRGVEIAFADHGNTLAGHPIKYLPQDGSCSVLGGQTAATRIAANRQFAAVLGMTCSAEAAGGAPILAQAGMPVAVTSATTATLTAPDRPAGLQVMTRFVYNDDAAAVAAVDYVRSLGMNRAATLSDGSIYAEELTQAFTQQFRAKGGSIVAAVTVAPSSTDLHLTIGQIGAAQPQILFAPVYADQSTRLLRQVGEVRSMAEVAILGTDTVMTSAFLDAVGRAAVGYRMIGADNSVNLADPRYREFIAKYKARFGEAPISNFHANAYNAAVAVMAAVESVARTDADGTTYIGRKALRDALAGTTNLDGLGGKLTCNRNGDCGSTDFAVFEYVNGNPGSFDVGMNPKRVYFRADVTAPEEHGRD